MHRIYPTHSTLGSVEDLVAAYAYPDPTSVSYVRANMVATVDGAAWGSDHRSGSISSSPDRRVFHVLRGLADVILVGAGTVRAESYGPAIANEELAGHRARLGQAPVAAMAVISASLDLDPAAPLFTEAVAPTIVLTTEHSPAARRAALAEVATVVVAGRDAVVAGEAVAALAASRLPRVLCEGGPCLLAELAADHVVDELCLTVTPQLVGGDAPRIVRGLDPGGTPLELVHILEENGTLLTRWQLVDVGVTRRRAPRPAHS